MFLLCLFDVYTQIRNLKEATETQEARSIFNKMQTQEEKTTHLLKGLIVFLNLV